jgi:hypothetical protein
LVATVVAGRADMLDRGHWREVVGKEDRALISGGLILGKLGLSITCRNKIHCGCEVIAIRTFSTKVAPVKR